MGDLKKIGQGRLVAAQDAELEEGGVAAADLGQANQLGVADDDLMGGEGAVARGQEDSGERVIARFELGDVFSGLVYVYAARICDTESAQPRGEEVAEPAVGLGHIFRDAGAGDADRAAHHALIQEQGAAAGTPLQDLDARGFATLGIDDRREAVA